MGHTILKASKINIKSILSNNLSNLLLLLLLLLLLCFITYDIIHLDKRLYIILI